MFIFVELVFLLCILFLFLFVLLVFFFFFFFFSSRRRHTRYIGDWSSDVCSSDLEGAPLPLDQICDLFDGECEIYKGFHVRRVLEARYIDGAGSPATIDIHLSKFGTTESAYAMFTKRDRKSVV